MTRFLMMLFVALVAAMSLRADTWTDPDTGYTWSYRIKDGEAEIFKEKLYYGTTAISPNPTGAVVIPSVLGGMPVTSIGGWVFYGCSELTGVTIPNSVTNIGQEAFSGCSGLTSMTIPKGVMRIGYMAFTGCSNIKSVAINSASIGESAFQDCTSLVDVLLSDSVVEIGFRAFSGCKKVKCINIPNSVTSIGSQAFWYCTSLANVSIPDSVTSIGAVAFYATPFFDAQPEGLVMLGKCAYEYKGDCPNSVVIPDGTVSICERALNSGGMTSVTIPDSVTSIGDNAFSSCSGLTSVTIGNGVTSIGKWAFYGCSGLAHVTIPNSVTSIGYGAFKGCSRLAFVTMPGRFEGNINSSVFAQCANNLSIHYMYTWLDVIFDAHGGVVEELVRTVAEGAALGSLPVPCRENYSCLGWYATPDGGDPITANEKVWSSTTYYAHWQINQYKMTFNANGGSGGKSVTQDYGSAVAAPTVTRAGYTFTGWSPAVPSTVPAANTTYTAQWQINQYEVAFDANGGDGGKSATQDYGSALTAPTVTRTGYTFTGWSPEVGAMVPASNVMYTAQWRVNQYEVAFDGNGGALGDRALPSVTNTQEYGSAIVAPTATREGYTFTGWQPAPLEMVPASNVTYTAQWRINQYEVAFDGNGGALGESSLPSVTNTQDHGSAIAAPEVLREGYTFVGWFPTVDATVPASNVTYTAQWRINQYDVIFDANGGVGSMTNKQDYASEIIVPTVTREGCSFEGWSPDVDLTVPASNVTYMAQWKVWSVILDSTGHCLKMVYPNDYHNITNVIITQGIKEIPQLFFEGCCSLTHISIPESVTKIGADAFSGCSSLRTAVMPWSLLGDPPDDLSAHGWMMGYQQDAFSANSWIRTEVDGGDLVEFRSNKIPHNGSTSMVLKMTGPQRLMFKWKVSSEKDGDCLRLSIDGIVKSEISGTGNDWGADWTGVIWDVPEGEHIVTWTYSKDSSVINGDDCGWVRIRFLEKRRTMESLFGDACDQLTHVTLTGMVSEITTHAFDGCSKLEAMEIPATVTNIGAFAFADCRSIKHITIPDSVINIGDGAFDGCTGLVSATLPLPEEPNPPEPGFYEAKFTGLNSLDGDIGIIDNAENIKISAEKLYSNIDEYAMYAYGAYMYLQEDVTYWFSACYDNFVTIKLDENLLISPHDWYYGDQTASASFQSSGWHWIELRVYNSNDVGGPSGNGVYWWTNENTARHSFADPGDCSLFVTKQPPKEATLREIFPNSFDKLVSVTLTEGAKSIPKGFFSGCATLTSVTLPDGVTRIGPGAFDGCTSLASLDMPNTLTDWGLDSLPPAMSTSLAVYDANGFCIVDGWLLDYQNKDAASLVVPEGIVGIGAGALAGMYDLETVTLPQSLKYIATGAFQEDTYLDNLVIPDGVEIIGESAFEDCSFLQTMTLGKGVKSVGARAFAGCTQLSGAVFAEGLLNVGALVFNGCWRMQSVSLPLSTTNVASSAFSGCTALTGVTVPTHGGKMSEWFAPVYSQIRDVTVPEGETKVRANMFEGCGSLQTVQMSDSITNIAARAFYGCSSLPEVRLPESLLTVGGEAFRNCSSLAAAALPENVTRIGARAFQDCSRLSALTLPRGLESLPDYVFAGCSSLDSFVVPEAVTYLGNYIVSGYTTAIYYLGNAPAYGVNVYGNTSGSLKSYVILGTKGWDGRPNSRDIPASWNGRDILTWSVNQFDVTFDANGGLFFPVVTNTYACEETTYTGYSLPPFEPVCKGMDFDGYWTEPNGGTRVFTSTRVLLTKPHTLYAHWKRGTTIKVRFNACGGTVSPDEDDYVAERPYCELPVPVREHFAFAGWWTEASGGSRVEISSEVPKAAHELFAHWMPNSYMIRFHANNGTDATVDQSFTYGDTVVLRLNPFSFESREFEGWALEPGGAAVYADGKTFTDVSAIEDDIIHLYAVWSGDTYAVRFDSHGGVGRMDNQTFTIGVAQPLFKCDYTREGFTFAGWALSTTAQVSYGDMEEVQDLSLVKDSTVVLYAVWVWEGGSGGDTPAILVDVDESYMVENDGSFGFNLTGAVYSISTPKVAVKGLPPGLKYDANTMTISGRATKPGTYTVTMSATNANVKKPVTKTFDIVVPNLRNDLLPGLEQGEESYGTLMCGSALPMDLIDCSPAEEGWTVKVTGLPAGLKFTAKDIMKKGSKTEVEIPANTVYGVPTKAGTFTVTFTASKKGEPDQVATITLNVEALPTWAQGTFTGYVRYDGEGDGATSIGYATMTAASNGKVSGKIALDGTNWTFSATSFSRTEYVKLEGDVVETNLVVEAVATSGKATMPVELALRPSGCDMELINAAVEGTFGDGEVKLWRGMWKDKTSAALAKTAAASFSGAYTAILSPQVGSGHGSGYLLLTAGKDGSVKATGKLADGTGVTASSPIMYDPDAGWFAIFYSAPSAYKGGSFAAAVGFEAFDGSEAAVSESPYRLVPVMFAPMWTSRNPQATGAYGKGFERELSLLGAHYDKTAKLSAWCGSLQLWLESAPELGFAFKRTYVDGSGRKVSSTEQMWAMAANTLWQPGLTATVNEKGAISVMKATKPVQDRETKEWSYGGDNDGAFTLSFAQATGIVKGTYTFWYDYVSAQDDTSGKATMVHTSKKVSFEGVLVQGEDPQVEGYYLWDEPGEYVDEKTGKPKAYKYKLSLPVRFLAE